MTILTDEEIALAVGGVGMQDDYPMGQTWGEAKQDYRAVIAAYEAKLREQEPDYWANPDSINHVQMLVNAYSVKGHVPLYKHPAPIPEGWTAIHLKTGNEYQVIGEAIDATNMHSNQLMVIYQRDGKTFVREAEEFQEKFKAMAAARSGE